MINFRSANRFCCEDIRLIENYEDAVNDPEIWDCHHRLESDLGLTRDELIEQGKYFKVPANELIFLTHAEHARLHQAERMKDPNKRKKCGSPGEKNPMYGKNPEDYMSEEAIKARRKKLSDTMKERMNGEKNPMYGKSGEKNPAYGRTWMNNGYVRAYPKTQGEIERYLERGYVFGYKLK